MIDQLISQNCFVCVGAGLSRGAGFPDWKGLLRKMIRWGVENDVAIPDQLDLEKAVEKGKLLEVAEELRERFGKEQYFSFLKVEFLNVNYKPTASHRLLPQIPFISALTFNYDKLLENAYILAGEGKSLPTFTQLHKAELVGALRSNDFFVLKAHGTIDDIQTIILGRKDYRELIQSNSAYKDFLRTYFTQKTALFIGCSLTDPDIQLMLEGLKVVFDGYDSRHFALMDVTDLSEFECGRFEKDYNIKIIPYKATAEDHPEARGFLEELSETIRNRKSYLSFYKNLCADSQEWFDNNRDESILYRGIKLTKAQYWHQVFGSEWRINESDFFKECELQELIKEENRNHESQLKILEEELERYKLVQNSTDSATWDWDLITNEIYFDQRWCQVLGCDGNELPANMDEWLNRIHPEDIDSFNTEVEGNMLGWAEQFRNEHRILHKDGEYRWILVRGLSAADEGGTIYRMAGSITDITDTKGAEQQLLYNAFHDVLTGLPNRTLFMDRLKRSMNRSNHRNDYLFATLFLFLDRFKVINQNFGHQVGDELLIGIARRLEKCMRPGDMISRLNGDEFAVILDNLRTVDDALIAADMLLQELIKPYLLSGREIYTSASVGIALSQAHYETADDFLHEAYAQMYEAKNRGRGCVVLFETEMHEQAIERLKIETDLPHALHRNEFRVFYHPIVSTASRQIQGLEALIRWEHPEEGLLLPTKFIEVAEKTGMISQMDMWVLREACIQVLQWQKEFPSDSKLSVSVNLSEKHFAHPDLVLKVRKILDETGLIPLLVNLEIKESSLFENPDAAAQTLRSLKELGVRITLDDFGTGYSSLSYFHRFPIDVMKIDRSFINRLGIINNSEIVRTLISLATNLGIEVIAEGVETEVQAQQLEFMGCNYFQGYLISKPLNTKDSYNFLSTRTKQ